MPNIVWVENVGRLGIIQGIPPHELPPEAWSDGQNVRMQNGAVVKFQGHQAVFGTPSTTPYWCMPVPTTDTFFWLYAGIGSNPTYAKVYATDQSSHGDITGALSLTANADQGWNGCMISGIAVINNGNDPPLQWTPALANSLVQLSNWPASTTAKVVKAFKAHLIAIDVTKSGTRYPYMVKWSHPAGEGSVPSTWDYTDTTKDAGEVELKATPDILIDCVQLNDMNILYKEDTTWRQTYIGRPYIWRFERVLGESGILSRRCAKEFFGQHLVASKHDLIIHNGMTGDSILPEKFRRAVFNNIDSTYYQRSFLTVDHAKREAWFCYPEVGSELPSLALVWNWKENNFGLRELDQIAHIDFGRVALDSDSIWDNQAYSIAAASGFWDSAQANRLLMCYANSSDPNLFVADETNQFDGSNMTSSVTRTGIAVVGKDRNNNPKIDLTSMKLVTRVWLKMRSSGSVNVYVGSQDNIDGAVSWNAAQSFNPNTDNYIDCYVIGRLPALKIESTGDVSWELDGYGLEMSLVGMY